MDKKKRSVHILLTSTCIVYSNVYALVNSCIGYLTVVDSVHSTSPPDHTYHTRTSVSVEVPLLTTVRNSSTIGVVPVTQDTFTWRLSTWTACCIVSLTEQGSAITFTNVLQGYKTVVLVSCTSEWEPDTCTSEKEEVPMSQKCYLIGCLSTIKCPVFNHKKVAHHKFSNKQLYILGVHICSVCLARTRSAHAHVSISITFEPTCAYYC